MHRNVPAEKASAELTSRADPSPPPPAPRKKRTTPAGTTSPNAALTTWRETLDLRPAAISVPSVIESNGL